MILKNNTYYVGSTAVARMYLNSKLVYNKETGTWELVDDAFIVGDDGQYYQELKKAIGGSTSIPVVDLNSQWADDTVTTTKDPNYNYYMSNSNYKKAGFAQFKVEWEGVSEISFYYKSVNQVTYTSANYLCIGALDGDKWTSQPATGDNGDTKGRAMTNFDTLTLPCSTDKHHIWFCYRKGTTPPSLVITGANDRSYVGVPKEISSIIYEYKAGELLPSSYVESTDLVIDVDKFYHKCYRTYILPNGTEVVNKEDYTLLEIDTPDMPADRTIIYTTKNDADIDLSGFDIAYKFMKDGERVIVLNKPMANTGTLLYPNPITAFNNQTNLATVQAVFTGDSLYSSKITEMKGLFKGCTNLVDAGIIDAGKVLTNGFGYGTMESMFEGCSKLKSVELVDTNGVKSTVSMFKNCKSLEYVPEFSMYNLENASFMFEGCSKLTGISGITGSLSIVKNACSMFSGCSSLKTLPGISFSSATNMSYCFEDCSSLESIEGIDTSKATDMRNIFNDCSSLKAIPDGFSTDNVTLLTAAFLGCSSLTTIPQINTSKVTNMNGLFFGCTALTTIPQLDMSSVTSAYQMFWGCRNLETIPALDTSNVTDFGGIFDFCDSLKSVEGIDFSSEVTAGLSLFAVTEKPLITRFIVNGKLNFSFDHSNSIKALTNIDYDSVKSILVAASKCDTSTAKTLAFNRTMSDPDGTLQNIVSICTGKGWTITGLTLTE